MESLKHMNAVEEIYRKADLARLLKVCTRTIDRRRLLDAVYATPHQDRNGWPVWDEKQVKQIIEREKGIA